MFALVGGAQEPVTELLLEATSHSPDAADTARRFLDTLARLLKEQLAVPRVA